MTLKQFLCELSDIGYDNAEALFNNETICGLFSALGEGCTRWVFEITYEDTAYAVKFALSKRNQIHNRREERAWRTANKKVRAVMAEVYGTSTCGRVLAMELVPKTLEESDCEEVCEAWNDKLRNILEDSGLTYSEADIRVDDNHPGNIGVRANGEMIWIDYAYGMV